MIVIWRVPELRTSRAHRALLPYAVAVVQRKQRTPRALTTPVVVVDRTSFSIKGRVGGLSGRTKEHPPAKATVQNERDRSANREERWRRYVDPDFRKPLDVGAGSGVSE